MSKATSICPKEKKSLRSFAFYTDTIYRTLRENLEFAYKVMQGLVNDVRMVSWLYKCRTGATPLAIATGSGAIQFIKTPASGSA